MTRSGHFSVEGSPRSLVPQALVSVLTVLIDDLDDAVPSSARVELRVLRSRLCRLFKIPDPQSEANASALAQEVAEQDGIPIEE